MSIFDSSLKDIQQRYAGDLVTFLGPILDLDQQQPLQFTPLDTELPVTTYQSDVLVRIEGDDPRIVHVEYESSSRLGRPKRFMRYNVLTSERENLEVDTVVILLRPQAESSDMTGNYIERKRSRKLKLLFTYDIIRVWQLPPEAFLAAGPGLWALAPLANVTESRLPHIMNELKDRWNTRPQHEMNDLISLTNVLMGLRYNAMTVQDLFRGVKGMEDSVTYQIILNRGEQIGLSKGERKGLTKMAHLSLVAMLELKFGSVHPEIQAAIREITDDQRLTNMIQSVAKINQPEDILNVV